MRLSGKITAKELFPVSDAAAAGQQDLGHVDSDTVPPAELPRHAESAEEHAPPPDVLHAVSPLRAAAASMDSKGADSCCVGECCCCVPVAFAKWDGPVPRLCGETRELLQAMRSGRSRRLPAACRAATGAASCGPHPACLGTRRQWQWVKGPQKQKELQGHRALQRQRGQQMQGQGSPSALWW